MNARAYNYYNNEFTNTDLALHTFTHDYDILEISAGCNYCFFANGELSTLAKIVTAQGEFLIDMPVATLNIALER